MINKLKRLLRRKVPGVIFMALMVGLIAAPGAKAALIDLGDAGPQNWAVLSIDGGVQFTSSSVLGPFAPNVGVFGGDANFSSSSVAGKLVLQTGRSLFGDPNQFAGGVQQDAAGDALLASSAAAAIAASAFYADPVQNPITPGFDNLVIDNNNHELNITGLGLVIADVTSITLTGTNFLTIIGGPGDGIVLNLPAVIASLNGVVDAQGVDPLNILLNQTNAGTYSFTSANIEAIWLSPDAALIVSGSQIGEAIGESVQFHSTSTITNPFIPIPPTAVLLGSGLLGLGLLGGRKHWFRRN